MFASEMGNLVVRPIIVAIGDLSRSILKKKTPGSPR